ncbi:MAG: hypothetical protein U1E78_01660 [Gammaproteobacteria bacterium]
MALGNNGWNNLNTIRTINENLQGVFALNANIHTYSRQIGTQCRQVLQLDQQHQLSSNTGDFEAVTREILNHSGNNPRVITVLNSIRANRAATEPETGLNIADLLIRTWDLTRKAGYHNARDVVIDNLNHNIVAGGGCLAGIAARLAQPYLALAANTLEQRLLQPQQPLYTPQYQDHFDFNEEEQIALAMQLSQQSSHADFDDDAELAEVLKMSKYWY